MTATQKVFNLRSHTRQGRLLPQQGLQLRRIFTLSESDAMGVFLPRRANVIAMAKQAFVPMNIFGNRLTDVIAAPCGRVILCSEQAS